MNKGEWSEFYVFLKLLGEGEIYAADSSLNILPNCKYPVKSITKENVENKQVKFNVCPDIGFIKIELPIGTVCGETSQREFVHAAESLLSTIKSGRGSFDAPLTRDFIKKIFNPKIKSNSKSKRDISVALYDINLAREEEYGFSIKSTMGGNSTLLNAGRSTNFIFEVAALKNYRPKNKHTFKKEKPNVWLSSF